MDGEFKGEIKAKGDVVVGEAGRVEASIEARNVLVGGTIKGNIVALGKVDIAPTGKLFGDMRVRNLMIEEGAVFKGNCLMEKEDSEKTKQHQQQHQQQQHQQI